MSNHVSVLCVNIPNCRDGFKMNYAGIWKAEFKKQFFELQNWELEQTSGSSEMTRKPQDGYTQFREYGEVNFSCGRCCHPWSSSHGAVVFYCWSAEPRRPGGVISMELLRQKCKKCEKLAGYQTPQWKREEVSEVVSSLLVKVKARYYHIKLPRRESRNQHRNERKSSGPRRGPHISRLCEACEKGVCTEREKGMVAVNINDSDDSVSDSTSSNLADGLDSHEDDSHSDTDHSTYAPRVNALCYAPLVFIFIIILCLVICYILGYDNWPRFATSYIFVSI